MKYTITRLLMIILFLHCTLIIFASETQPDLFGNPVVGTEAAVLIEGNALNVVEPGEVQGSIRCFAVGEDGRIAIGTQTASNAMVCILDPEGKPLSAYAFDCSSEFGVFFLRSDLAIYYNRANLIITYDTSGQGTSVYAIPTTQEYRELTAKAMEATQIEQNGVTYKLERDIKFDDREYSRLVRYNGAQQRTVLYDVTPSHNFRVAVCDGGLALFAAFAIYLMIRRVKQSK